MTLKDEFVFDTLSDIKERIPTSLFDNLMKIITNEEGYEDHDYTT